ncbi:MAG: hypothetical protein KME12_16305 [Trichocoleus desertorum ATA4-8-CV12]|nr:hypothetical protein [Trichocoleus desertorum ATA4-8-CV12]
MASTKLGSRPTITTEPRRQTIRNLSETQLEQDQCLKKSTIHAAAF